MQCILAYLNRLGGGHLVKIKKRSGSMQDFDKAKVKDAKGKIVDFF